MIQRLIKEAFFMTRSPASSARRKTALVTGASRGIGLELTRLLAQDGHDLVLVARSEDALHQIAGKLERTYEIRATVLVQDLSRPEAPGEMFDVLQADSILIDVLVNNAGFGLHGPFREMNLDAGRDLLQVNNAALTALTRRLLPGMLERGSGRILNVASLAAFMPGPMMAVYHASKAYVLRLSVALAEELRGSGVTVTALCPGYVRTGFQDRAGVDLGRVRMARLGVMSAARVARIGYRGTMRGKSVIIPGVLNKLLALGSKLGPRWLVTRIAHWLQA
jgi:hypothetical protein